MIEYRTIRVGLLGAGSVGSQVARLLLEHSDELTRRIGARIELVGIAVRDIEARRDAELPRELLTTDADALILGSDIGASGSGLNEFTSAAMGSRSARATSLLAYSGSVA